MKTKHTPGPWSISWNTFNGGEEHGIYANGELDLKGFQIAKVNYYPGIYNYANEETGKANAKLIAAAPELLRALIDCVENILINFPDDDKTKIAYRAIIDKVTK